MKINKRFSFAIAAFIVVGLSAACSDYSFSPLTQIAVLPGSVAFPLKVPKGMESGFREIQHYYIENRSISASIRLFNMYMVNKEKNNQPVLPYFVTMDGDGNKNETPLFDDNSKNAAVGYYYNANDNHLFKLDVDFDLRFLVTDNLGNRRVLNPDKTANYVTIKGYKNENTSDPNNITDLYTMRDENGAELQVGNLLTLYGMNYCDQLVVRDYLKKQLVHKDKDSANAATPPKIYPTRDATFRQLASEVDVRVGTDVIKKEAATMNPWKKELELASCQDPSCRYKTFYETMMAQQHPDIYGQDAANMLDESGLPDWEKIAVSCKDGDAYKPELLSMDIVDGSGQMDEFAIKKLVKLDTIKTIVRYTREPKIVLDDGTVESARKFFICDRPETEINAKCAVSYGELNPIQNSFVAHLSHDARVDVSATAEEQQVSQFLAKVDISLAGKSAAFPVPQITQITDPTNPYITLADDPNDKCGKIAQVPPLAKVIINAADSYSPNGFNPLSFYWEMLEKPAQAVDAVLTCRTCSFQNPLPIINKWDVESTPKIYLPLAGTYKMRVKVRDSRNVASDDPGNTEGCHFANLTLKVVPENKVYVQLAWDKGDDIDMDLSLARYRECGTIGLIFTNDILVAPALTMPNSCANDSDCCPAQNGGLCTGLTCSGGSCVTQCSDDDYCKKAHPGYTCNNGQCSDNSQRWMCRDDIDVKTGDCKGKGYCVQYLENNVPKKVCTTHNYAQVNDSCGFNNRGPDWGTQLDTSDNPTLDIDDVDGFGPETISMKNPPKDQNKYRVMVRLYADPNQPTSGKKITKDNPVKAFVSIYLNKEACQSKAVWQPFQMTLQHWKVADITWKGDATTCDDINILPLNPPVPVPMTDLNYLTEALNVQCLDIQNPACEYANPFKAVPAGLFDPCSTTQPRSIWCDAPGTPDCCYKTNTCTCCP